MTLFRPRVSKADVSELDIEFLVAPFFNGKTALIHVVVDIEKFEIGGEKALIRFEAAESGKQTADTPCNSSKLSHIFDHTSHRKNAEDAIKTDDQIREKLQEH